MGLESNDNIRRYINMDNISPIVMDILDKRGIKSEQVEEFLSPKPRLMHDPFLLYNMEAGVDLILDAIDSGDKIVIYGDYDVDGITSTALMMKVLGSLDANVDYYIPDRLDEGYGLHKSSIEKIASDGGKVIITVDCGSVSEEETEYAHELGIRTVITDHHSISDRIAKGIVINPKQYEDKYPFKGLAGVGVAYKFALALSKKRKIPANIMKEILELATIGTIADIMPLVDENRTIVKFGLYLMRQGCMNKGLRKLIEKVDIKFKDIGVTDISFRIAPRINAAGRLKDASIGVKTLLAEDDEDIERYCRTLIETNQQRRQIQDSAFKTGMQIVKDSGKISNIEFIEINDSHEGVLGIVAGKIREEINRPVVIVSKKNDLYKGTGRSIESINMFEVFDKYRNLFESFGGHSAACGFTIHQNHLEKLKKYVNDDVEKMLETENSLFDIIHYSDMNISINDIDMKLATSLQLMEPFGKGNEEPLFRLNDVSVTNWKFLSDNRFGRFRAKSYNTSDNFALDCITFSDAEKMYNEIYSDFPSGKKVDVIGNIEINKWRNMTNIQFKVKYLECSDDK